MKKYFANMNVNNGTHFRPDWESTNKSKLTREIASTARANCFVGNVYSWKVWDETGKIVAAGAGIKTIKLGIQTLNVTDLIGTYI